MMLSPIFLTIHPPRLPKCEFFSGTRTLQASILAQNLLMEVIQGQSDTISRIHNWKYILVGELNLQGTWLEVCLSHLVKMRHVARCDRI